MNNTSNSVKIRKLVTISILATIVIVLQLLGNFIEGFMNNLALGIIPIAIAAILYGPKVGALLGFVMSAVILINPSNYLLMENWFDILKLILIILIKTPLAGFVCGLIYKLLSNRANKIEDKAKRTAGIIFAIAFSSIFVVIVNTLSYFLLMLAFFAKGSIFVPSGLEGFTLNKFNLSLGESSYTNIAVLLILGFIGVNFIIELGIIFIATPAIISIVKMATKHYNLGFENDFSVLREGKTHDSFIS